MYILKGTKEDMLDHAAACYPNESCGYIIDRKYVPCTNVHDNPDKQFKIGYKDVLRCEQLGTIEAVVHSHPNGSSKPTTFDLMQMSMGDVPWVIVAYPEIDIKVHAAKKYKAPLINREYIHGVLDCFSIVRDYYRRELGIEIDNFEREDLWWESAGGPDLYIDNFSSQGFVQVHGLRRHDVILCRVQPTEYVNHALIYLGDDGDLTSETTETALNDHLVLHHPYMRRSRREIYGKVWQERTAIIVRHKSFL